MTDRTDQETGWQMPWDEPAKAWDGVSPLSSDAAVRAALQNNRAIRGQVEEIVASRAEFVQAHLLPNPVVNIAIGFPTDGTGGQPLSASFVQQLAALWRRPDAIDEATAELQAKVLRVSDAALQLSADVRSTHASVVFAEQSVALQQENIELLQRSVDLLNARLEVGEASQLDVNRIRLELNTARNVLEDRTATLQRNKRELLALLGRAEASSEWSTDGDVAAAAVMTAAGDEQSCIVRSTAQRLDVAAARTMIEARAAGVRYQESGTLPDVRGGLGYQKNFSDRPGVFPSASMSVPMLDDNRARVARAASKYRRAIIEADGMLQQAVQETRTAWVNAHSQWRVIESFESEIVGLAMNNFDLATDAFGAGEIDLTVLLEAQRQLNYARVELADRRAAAATSVFELERAVGGSFDLTIDADGATFREDQELSELDSDGEIAQ